MTERLYRYVRLDMVPTFLAGGWIPLHGFDGTHHGRHSVLMRACHCYRVPAPPVIATEDDRRRIEAANLQADRADYDHRNHRRHG